MIGVYLRVTTPRLFSLPRGTWRCPCRNYDELDPEEVAGWEDYVANSVNALAKVVTLAPGARAHLDTRSESPRPIYTSLLHSNRLKELVVEGGSVTEVPIALSGLSPQPAPLVILSPKLWQPNGLELLTTCLIARPRDLNVRLNNTYGGLPLPTLTAARCVPQRESHPHFDALLNYSLPCRLRALRAELQLRLCYSCFRSGC